VLAEFGDDPHRYASAKARRNYAGTPPSTRASGKWKVVIARFVHNDALRRLASRLVGILHGCLKTRTLYDETTAWGHRENPANHPQQLDHLSPGMSLLLHWR